MGKVPREKNNENYKAKKDQMKSFRTVIWVDKFTGMQ